MDYLLPDDEALKKMTEEYSTITRKYRGVPANETAADAYLNLSDGDSLQMRVIDPSVLLSLYIAFVLGYNSGYETAIYDSDRGLGGLQPGQGSVGDVDNFFRRTR